MCWSTGYSGFEAEGHANGDSILRLVLADPEKIALPDLLVIDLQPDPDKLGGLGLIAWLKENNVSSAIIATMENLSSSAPKEAMIMGADHVGGKPFEPRLMDLMENLARMGRLRRMYQTRQAMDPSRHHRPIFLSYCDKDRRIASIIKSRIEAHEIGVWYSSDTLKPGQLFKDEIATALDRARVFVPVITNHYMQSAFCMAELLSFYRRLRGAGRPLLLPVRYGEVEQTTTFDRIKWVFNEHQYADMTDDHFISGLTALVSQIESTVRSGRH
jgi:hypothetical protein